MNTVSAELKQYEEKIAGQLDQARAQLERLEARAREKKAQTEIDAVNSIKAMKLKLEEQHQQLRTTSGENAAKVKSEIDAGMIKLKTGLEQVTARLHGPAPR